MLRFVALSFAISLLATAAQGKDLIKVLIVDGQNNHDWKATTPLLKQSLETAGLFHVDVATSGPKDTAGFKPDFARYQVVLSNYNGADWPKETEQALVDFVKNGGGLVIVHAADNSFPNWKEFNQMIGLGGWGGRTEKSGPYVRFKDGALVRDTKPGPGGHHGTQHDFLVTVRSPNHPITAGMPSAWLHAKDELYDLLRGPAENIDVLATAYADPSQGGSAEHEPMIFTVTYGKGRVFHTPMGHSPHAMTCVGFITTLQRGAEWAATGKVTQPIPKDFPTAANLSLRDVTKRDVFIGK